MNQEQSSNTSDFWANTVCNVVDGILKWTLQSDQKEAIKANVRQWVIDIREDETNAIIREIEKVQAAAPGSITNNQILGILRARLPKRI